MSLTLDSGCAWHVHTNLDDLVNVRPCEDTFSGVDNIVHGCSGVGDLPFVCLDASGSPHRLLLRNVRCVPTFTDTLLSVDQLWEQSRIRVVFEGKNLIELPPDPVSGALLRFNMKRNDGLFEIEAFGNARERRDATSTRALLANAGIRSAHARSHIDRLGADDVAKIMHRRLHAGVDRLRKLPDFCHDAPDALRRTRHAPCSACTEANATHLHHKSDQYAESYPGRLIHADIAGPFINSRIGHYKYLLVLVDDHSRFKFVQFLRHRDDAPAAVSNFAAALTGLLGKQGQANVITTFHSDNAGEFFSREFTEFLDGEAIAHTSCPPHIHELNGVAERSIKSIMEGVRSAMTASGAPKSFWPYAAQHACDVLNRTTGPPAGTMSSYESLLGEKPRIMGIMPFGCRGFAVKPHGSISKTNIDPHAWVGVNLGRSPDMPGAFHVWLPDLHKVVSSSDVYFDETLMPWLPPELQRVDCPIAQAASEDLPAALPSPELRPPKTARPSATDSASAMLDSQRARGSAAVSSRRVLVLFSGPYNRPDGLNVFLTRLGLQVDLIDCDEKYGGGDKHDLARDRVFEQLLRDAHRGLYRSIIAAPPCSTFSVSRLFVPEKGDPGPPPVRDREHILGLPDLDQTRRREVRAANELVLRTVALCLACFDAGGEFLIENPADRGDRGVSHFMDERHAPLWLFPAVDRLRSVTSGELITFPQCALGADFQKYTTFLCSSAFAAQLRSLTNLRCTHASHKQVGGQRRGDAFTSGDSAAYPADLNLLLAQCCATMVSRIETPPPIAPRATPEPSPIAHALPAASSFSPPEATAVGDDGPTPDPPATDPSADDAPDSDDDVPTPKRTPRRPKVRFERPGHHLLSTLRPRGTRTLPALALHHNNTFNVRRDFWRGEHKCLLSSRAPDLGDPANRKSMLRQPDVQGWISAEKAELKNHADNQSFTYLDRSALPNGRKLVRMTWVYKRKRSGKLKARLCVQGCSQVPGVDYNQTFCATMRSTTLRLLSAVAARQRMHMRRWDFVAAYLQGSLESEEVVYCHSPPGYETLGADGKPKILRINKPVYGMAQSGRRWQRSIFPWLEKWGLKPLYSDPCVFRRAETVTLPDGSTREEQLIIGMYVDDLFVLHSHDDAHSLYQRFTADLTHTWEAEDEGEVSDLLNVEFTRSSAGVKLSQGGYIDTLVERFCPDGVPLSFHDNQAPAAPDLRELVDEAISEHRKSPAATAAEVQQFQCITGALLYAAVNTRPDIALATGLLCRVMAKPTPELMQAAIRVVWYLARHRDVGLTYAPDDAALTGLSDSDWATRHSTGGHVFTYSRAAITWASKKQPSVALSSCEAELMALSEATKEALYLDEFLKELGLSSGKPISLGCDNQAAGDLAYNPEHHQRTKHIARRHFFVREAVEDLRLVVPFVRTADNLADFFTKPLAPRHFFRMRDLIMNVPS